MQSENENATLINCACSPRLAFLPLKEFCLCSQDACEVRILPMVTSKNKLTRIVLWSIMVCQNRYRPSLPALLSLNKLPSRI